MNGQQVEPVVGAQLGGVLRRNGKKLRPARKQANEPVAIGRLILKQDRNLPGFFTQGGTGRFVDTLKPVGGALRRRVKPGGIQYPKVRSG